MRVPSIAPRAPCLLVVALETAGHGVVDDIANIPLVHPHAIALCRHQKRKAVLLEAVLDFSYPIFPVKDDLWFDKGRTATTASVFFPDLQTTR